MEKENRIENFKEKLLRTGFHHIGKHIMSDLEKDELLSFLEK